ncbi:MAG: lactate utilization protein B/C [Chitinophagaceae bacterium]|nr:MAG: lactate utilization protein B/C [Chitinophagaceae bacterium]
MNKARENIFRKIRDALATTTPLPFKQADGTVSEIYRMSEDELSVSFAQRFTELQGKFSYCVDKAAFLHQFKALLQAQNLSKVYCIEQELCDELGLINFGADLEELSKCDVSVTSCECLVARTGSIILSAAQESGRNTSVYAPIHICVAYTSQVVEDIKNGIELLHKKYTKELPSLITLATGPSRTADIEKTLVVGVHGPKEVYVFLIEDSI